MIDFPGTAFSPSADRNKVPIGEIILPLLPDRARVLEIASGSGQHAHFMTSMRTDLSWQLSDQDPQSLENLKALRSTGLAAPWRIDVTDPDWWAKLGAFDVVYCANMIHIAPQAALPGLAKGTPKLINSDGQFFLYGPFLDGDNSAQSNLAFDSSLKSRNPEWGVKDLRRVKHIFADAGLACVRELDMPRDNSLLVFKHAAL